ncbi:MAG: DUF1080 domain-containing protein [Phycisphaerales bacterium]|nr:MAG: DUF1080 domain-containing protein [Phycisphaerales bacterium]
MASQSTRRLLLTIAVLAIAHSALAEEPNDGWISLFDGKTLNGWKASENQETFTVREGMIVAQGPRSHLFYVGPVEDHNFKDFEFKADIMTKPGSNSGMYFHTEYQQTGWPRKGCEVQVNNTHTDWIKTGSLYGVENVRKSLAKDNVWFTQHIIVDGRRVVVKVNGTTVVEYAAPDSTARRNRGLRLSSGTFALQGHDPKSIVYYKNVMFRPLPPVDFPLVDYHVHLKGGLTIEEAMRLSKERGVKFGIAENCGLGFKVTDDEGLTRFFDKLQGQPAYKAMQAEGREWTGLFSKEKIAKFDYVFSDALTFTDDDGRRTRLWMRNEVQVGDPEQFMEMYVGRIVGILNDEPIDIFVNPTFLPEVIAERYDALWTQKRMDRVIDAAVKNDVAIEINARYRIPSAAFIKRAKEAGAKFAFGTNNGGRDLGNLGYCRRIARLCGLSKDDMFTPRPEGQKAIQRKELRP